MIDIKSDLEKINTACKKGQIDENVLNLMLKLKDNGYDVKIKINSFCSKETLTEVGKKLEKIL